jgi:hypothetical protein
MATRQYTITTGSYSGYRIVGRIEGPAKPALSTLSKRFREQFYRQEEPNSYTFSPFYAGKISAKVRLEITVEQRMKDAGYEGWDVAELFIDWLCKDHGFKRIERDTFHVG